MHGFDKAYWEERWRRAHGWGLEANPYLVEVAGGLPPGRVLDAGCGQGAEAVWLAGRGWRVTAVDISGAALAAARTRAEAAGVADPVEWVEADLTAWTPTEPDFDLVMSHYVHPAAGLAVLIDRLATWTAPGGTLLVVGHQPHDQPHDDHHDHADHADHGRHGHHRPEGDRSRHTGHADHPVDGNADRGHSPPHEATASAEEIAARLDPERWRIVTAEPRTRTVARPHGQDMVLHDAVVHARRIA